MSNAYDRRMQAELEAIEIAAAAQREADRIAAQSLAEYQAERKNKENK